MTLWDTGSHRQINQGNGTQLRKQSRRLCGDPDSLAGRAPGHCSTGAARTYGHPFAKASESQPLPHSKHKWCDLLPAQDAHVCCRRVFNSKSVLTPQMRRPCQHPEGDKRGVSGRGRGRGCAVFMHARPRPATHVSRHTELRKRAGNGT